MSTDVLLLLGKAPKPGTIIHEVLAALAARGVTTEVALPHDATDEGALDEIHDAAREARLVLHRGLSRDVEPLLATLHGEGITLCNPWPGLSGVRDRTTMREVLVAAGIPTPAAETFPSWAAARDRAAGMPSIVKATGAGRGASVYPGDALPETPPAPGPYVVEQAIPTDGLDRKLYVVGGSVSGLLKSSPLAAGHTTTGSELSVTPALEQLALATAEAFGLHLLGVDVVQHESTGELFVVDVNAFPGYRSVAGAAAAVTEHLAAHLQAG